MPNSPVHDAAITGIDAKTVDKIVEVSSPVVQEALNLTRDSFEKLIIEVKTAVKGTPKERTIGMRLGLLADIYAEAAKLSLKRDKARSREMIGRAHAILHSYQLVAENTAIKIAYENWKGLMYLAGKLIRALGPIASAVVDTVNIPFVDVLVEKAVDAAADALGCDDEEGADDDTPAEEGGEDPEQGGDAGDPEEDGDSDSESTSLPRTSEDAVEVVLQPDPETPEDTENQ